jgi:hypothetical protein
MANMDESSDLLIDTIGLQGPNIADQHAPLISMTLGLPVNSNVFIQNMNVWNQETASSAYFNTLRPGCPSARNHCESAGTLHDEHQPSGSGDAKLEPPLRKVHTKSRRGCYSCKYRRVKVHQTYQITRQKINVYHSVQRIIQLAHNVLDVASNVNGQRIISSEQG